MALTNAERVARWRQRQKEDPEKHQQYKLKEKERYKKKKERGVVKSVTVMNKTERRHTRRNWRKNQRTKRERDRTLQAHVNEMLSPPATPTPEDNEEQDRGRPWTMKLLGRKKVRKDRAKAYRELFKLKVQLNKERRLKERYKKRFNRLKNDKRKSDPIEVSTTQIFRNKDERRALLLHSIMITQIKDRYRMTKNQAYRNFISTLICRDNILMKYRLGNYARAVLGLSRRSLHASDGKKKRIPVKPTRMKTNVVEFLERDDNSRVKAGKKATITRNKEKKQLRLLNDSLKNLHAKFLIEKNLKISYSKFCSLKPYWVVKPKEKDRDTCLCKTHENFIFKVERLYKEGTIHTNNLEQVIKELVCNPENKACMYKECESCKGKALELENEGDKQVWWYTWKNRRVQRERKNDAGEKIAVTVSMTVKEKEFGTLKTLADELNKEVHKVCRHLFNIKHQYKTLRLLRQDLTQEEIIVHIDFSENYNCKYSKSIQSIHFGASQRQISIHTGMAYTADTAIPFSTVSDILKHGPSGIWAHLDPILRHLKNITGGSIVHFVSDGPTTQYRCKNNFYLLSKKVFDLGFKYATWNFMEAGHGKGAPDGIGAAIKRQADDLVNVTEKDISCASDLVNGLALLQSSVKVFEISEELFKKTEKELPSSTELKTVPETMKIHQVVVSEKLVVQSRRLSCFCQKPNTCNCYGLQLTSYKDQEVLEMDLSTDVIQDGSSADIHSSSTHVVQPVSSAEHNDSNTELDQPGSRESHGPLKKSTEKSSATVILHKPDVVDESLISKWCVVEYDDLPYPGIIQDVDVDEAEVKVMHKIGRNRYFWPMMDDILWYDKSKIVTLLDDEPQPVTKRHHQINPNIWTALENHFNL